MDRLSDVDRAEKALHGSPFLNSDQAAAYLKISSRLLRRMRRNGGGPIYRRHSRYIQYHIDELDAWSAANSGEAFRP